MSSSSTDTFAAMLKDINQKMNSISIQFFFSPCVGPQDKQNMIEAMKAYAELSKVKVQLLENIQMLEK